MCAGCSAGEDRRRPEDAPDGRAADRPRTGLAALAMLTLIRLYRLTLSPFLGQWCRYLPTCSAYGEEAIRRHGGWAGGWMTLARLARCNPLGASGYDPVPEIPATAHWWAPWRYGQWSGRHLDPASRETEGLRQGAGSIRNRHPSQS